MRGIRRTRLRTSAGGTDRRRRHRFPAVLAASNSDRFPYGRPGAPEDRPTGDVDALLWEHAEILVAAVSER